jgi:tetratricopeptide (TPR) repeat protein
MKKKSIVIVLFFMFSLSLFADDANDAIRYSENGQKYMANKQYNLAVNEFTKALSCVFNAPRGYRINENAVSVYFAILGMRSLAYFELKNFQNAIQDCTNLINSTYNNTSLEKLLNQEDVKNHKLSGYYFRGLSYFQLKDYNKCIDDMTSALAIDRSWDSCYNYRARAYILIRDYDKAERDINTYLAKHPTDEEMLTMKEVVKTFRDVENIGINPSDSTSPTQATERPSAPVRRGPPNPAPAPGKAPDLNIGKELLGIQTYTAPKAPNRFLPETYDSRVMSKLPVPENYVDTLICDIAINARMSGNDIDANNVSLDIISQVIRNYADNDLGDIAGYRVWTNGNYIRSLSPQERTNLASQIVNYIKLYGINDPARK